MKNTEAAALRELLALATPGLNVTEEYNDGRLWALQDSSGYVVADVQGTEADAKLFAAAHGAITRLLDEREVMQAVTRWLCSRDCGTSSQTILAAVYPEWVTPNWPSVPMDSADFGRCARMMDTIPGVRERLSAVAERWPEWRRLVEHWDELDALYRAGRDSWTELTQRIRDLIKERGE